MDTEERNIIDWFGEILSEIAKQLKIANNIALEALPDSNHKENLRTEFKGDL